MKFTHTPAQLNPPLEIIELAQKTEPQSRWNPSRDTRRDFNCLLVTEVEPKAAQAGRCEVKKFHGDLGSATWLREDSFFIASVINTHTAYIFV